MDKAIPGSSHLLFANTSCNGPYKLRFVCLSPNNKRENGIVSTRKVAVNDTKYIAKRDTKM